MKKKIKLFLVFFLFLLSSSLGFSKEIPSVQGTYDIVVNGYDWGPAVDKVIIALDTEISTISAKDIAVIETKNWYPKKSGEGFSVSNFDRTVINAYISDEKGNKVKGDSKYFTLDLKVSPNEGSPFLYDYMVTYLNNWAAPYYLTIKLKEGNSLISGNNLIKNLSIDTKYTAKIMPEADRFQMSKFNSDNIILDYAYFNPKKDNKKNPLVIWLNGMGEGGNDPSIALLGNKVTALISKETQTMLKDAYVLVPQSPTFWMDNGSRDKSKFDGTSKYDKVLMDLIKNFVDKNPDIDKSKIIIGGCSNGGYMTIRTVLLNPEYFSAAFPICEAYTDKFLTDDMISTLKNVPMWFIFTINDPVVLPNLHEVPTLMRLANAGAKDLHITVYSNVQDNTGLYKNVKGDPYKYNGHWSWIPTLNNEVVENDLGLFEWAASKVNPNK